MVPGSAQWWDERLARPSPPRRPRANGLTLERILDGALSIVDSEGLEALTMRRLADHLGTSHPALYRHVTGHDEIVVLLVDRVLGLVRLGDTSSGQSVQPMAPRARAEAALRRYREVLLGHPALTPAFLRGQLLGPNALARREEALGLLFEVGAPPPLAARAYLVLTHFVITSAVFEASGAGRSSAERSAMEAYFKRLPTATYPSITSVAGELNDTDGLAEFEFGLAALLDHVERELGARPETDR